MARVKIENSWVTALPIQEVRHRLLGFFSAREISVEKDMNGTMWGDQGSQLITRIAGMWLANPAKFPKRIIINYLPIGESTQINVMIEETLGLGIMDPHSKDRYQNYFIELMKDLNNEFPPVRLPPLADLPPPSNVQTPKTPRPPKGIKHPAGNSNLNQMLDSVISLIVPDYMEPETKNEIVIELHNKTDHEFSDIKIDFSFLRNFFEIENEVIIPLLIPNMQMSKRIIIMPREESGSFPVRVWITSSGATIEKEYTIKVGGTEIY